MLVSLVDSYDHGGHTQVFVLNGKKGKVMSDGSSGSVMIEAVGFEGFEIRLNSAEVLSLSNEVEANRIEPIEMLLRLSRLKTDDEWDTACLELLQKAATIEEIEIVLSLAPHDGEAERFGLEKLATLKS